MNIGDLSTDNRFDHRLNGDVDIEHRYLENNISFYSYFCKNVFTLHNRQFVYKVCLLLVNRLKNFPQIQFTEHKLNKHIFIPFVSIFPFFRFISVNIVNYPTSKYFFFHQNISSTSC